MDRAAHCSAVKPEKRSVSRNIGQYDAVGPGALGLERSALDQIDQKVAFLRKVDGKLDVDRIAVMLLDRKQHIPKYFYDLLIL